MAAAIVNRLEKGYPDEPGDCAIVALSVYTGLPYTEVLRAVAHADRKQGRDGLWRKTIIRVAKRLGYTLRQRKLNEDGYGIVVTNDHAAVLRNGLVLDRDMVWELDDWLRSEQIGADKCVLLVSVD